MFKLCFDVLKMEYDKFINKRDPNTTIRLSIRQPFNGLYNGCIRDHLMVKI